MPHSMQANQIRQQPQRQGSLLGSLFSVLSMIPIPEVQMAGKVGNAFLNPSGSNLGQLATQTASMVGGKDSGGDVTHQSEDETPGMEVMDEMSKATEAPKSGKLDVSAVPIGGDTPDPVTDEESPEEDKKEGGKEENPLSLYSNMTMDEVFKMHPELQGMFTQHLFQS